LDQREESPSPLGNLGYYKILEDHYDYIFILFFLIKKGFFFRYAALLTGLKPGKIS
jgi:hypothetical protein